MSKARNSVMSAPSTLPVMVSHVCMPVSPKESGQSYPVHGLAHPPRLNRPVHTATGSDHSAIPESDEDNDVRGGGTD